MMTLLWAKSPKIYSKQLLPDTPLKPAIQKFLIIPGYNYHIHGIGGVVGICFGIQVKGKLQVAGPGGNVNVLHCYRLRLSPVYIIRIAILVHIGYGGSGTSCNIYTKNGLIGSAATGPVKFKGCSNSNHIAGLHGKVIGGVTHCALG